jgi:hypothetical protein
MINTKTNIYYQSCVHCTIEDTCDLGHTDCDKCGDDYEPYYGDDYEPYYEDDYEPYYDDMDMFNDEYNGNYFNNITTTTAIYPER